MTKIRKQKRKKKFRYNINKKKLRRKILEGPSIKCAHVRKEWQINKSVSANLKAMGLMYDVNKSLSTEGNSIVESTSGVGENIDIAPKRHVAEALEKDSKAPRERKLLLPDNQVRWLSYLISKHGEDYKAMSRDPKNHYQETWKQIRAKIKKFKNIPEQYDKFLKSQDSEKMETDNCVDVAGHSSFQA